VSKPKTVWNKAKTHCAICGCPKHCFGKPCRLGHNLPEEEKERAAEAGSDRLVMKKTRHKWIDVWNVLLDKKKIGQVCEGSYTDASGRSHPVWQPCVVSKGSAMTFGSFVTREQAAVKVLLIDVDSRHRIQIWRL
jgi:hypothetical protein